MLQIYNNLTRSKETFKPLVEGQVGLYVCGVTVYDYCHIGHGRTYVAFDVLARFLRYSGYNVKYVRNVTDIDDKIIHRANDKGVSFEQITEQFKAEMDADFARLGILPPDVEPTATQSMSDIIAMITQLIERGAAYQGEQGDVYFSVSSFADYGKLSKQNLADLRAGERVGVASDKRDPLDFVLWKSAKPDEPHWESPWGKGRPGWHIECSAMSKQCLGEHFDIHGGGSDLQFPHHENEIAQSEAANGCQFVNYWVHTGMVQVEKEKMSKSLGNFFTIRDVLKEYRPESVRFFLVSSHYRSQLNYSSDNLDAADASLERLYQALRGLEATNGKVLSDYEQRFVSAMNDDLNTAEAMAVLFDVARELNRARKEGTADVANLAFTLRSLGDLLGLLQQDPDAFLQSSNQSEALDVARIEQLIEERNQARSDRNFARSDEIRDLLLEEGIVLEDSREGTRWRKEG
ncbi:cysteine--tRNA ligase [Pleionea litopenaei]|uniref:Cysteine--tRNA ligase n=1 Tax=Pleionea litopenaei TaxID=3070815 RepID=A0AA51RU25_9GAMM|nr:cysteine--tRNA ligase [Pleionea sp. HL-JVS1]WMS87479.1 cysteine--tRNA ligase [Pleionea sp. HL-JVS1]